MSLVFEFDYEHENYQIWSFPCSDLGVVKIIIVSLKLKSQTGSEPKTEADRFFDHVSGSWKIEANRIELESYPKNWKWKFY